MLNTHCFQSFHGPCYSSAPLYITVIGLPSALFPFSQWVQDVLVFVNGAAGIVLLDIWLCGRVCFGERLLGLHSVGSFVLLIIWHTVLMSVAFNYSSSVRHEFFCWFNDG